MTEYDHAVDKGELHSAYVSRLPILKTLAGALEAEVQACLEDVPHVDRVSFRAKSVESFMAKTWRSDNDPPYVHPLEEVEDQVAGRVLVFFRSDIDLVQDKCERYFHPVESTRRHPAKDAEFGYESHHIVFTIPPQVKPDGWAELVDPPSTFELQIRTLFMHAWAEPQHDLGYKSVTDLPADQRRELAWIAASAWGADHALQRIFDHHQTTGSVTRGPEDGDKEPKDPEQNQGGDHG